MPAAMAGMPACAPLLLVLSLLLLAGPAARAEEEEHDAGAHHEVDAAWAAEPHSAVNLNGSNINTTLGTLPPQSYVLVEFFASWCPGETTEAAPDRPLDQAAPGAPAPAAVPPASPRRLTRSCRVRVCPGCLLCVVLLLRPQRASTSPQSMRR